MDPWGQQGFDLRFEWGSTGASRITPAHGLLVVVDVLSFTTCVSVATERGVSVYPATWQDGRAEQLAARVDAQLAVGRADVDREHPWSLSPSSLLATPAPARLVLPSPNGSAIAAASGGLAVACSLRNYSAVAAWIFASRAGTESEPVSVVAAGERWPDGSLRPALEDLLGAGAVLSALVDIGGYRLSPEAQTAVAAFRGTPSVAQAIRDCASGRELTQRGYSQDVDLAVELDVSPTVPVRRGEAFRASV